MLKRKKQNDLDIYTYLGKTKLKKEETTFVLSERTMVRFFKLRRF